MSIVKTALKYAWWVDCIAHVVAAVFMLLALGQSVAENFVMAVLGFGHLAFWLFLLAKMEQSGVVSVVPLALVKALIMVAAGSMLVKALNLKNNELFPWFFCIYLLVQVVIESVLVAAVCSDSRIAPAVFAPAAASIDAWYDARSA